MLDQFQAYVSEHQTLSAVFAGSLVLIVAYFLTLLRDPTPVLDAPLVDISRVKKGQIELNAMQTALSTNCEKVGSCPHMHAHRLKHSILG